RSHPLQGAHLRHDQHPALETRLAAAPHGPLRRPQAEVRLSPGPSFRPSPSPFRLSMKSDPPAPTDLLALLRQQLLLAQVRLMELEDERDELAPRLAEADALLAAAQSLA